jgi:hypothetical protein
MLYPCNVQIKFLQHSQMMIFCSIDYIYGRSGKDNVEILVVITCLSQSVKSYLYTKATIALASDGYQF